METVWLHLGNHTVTFHGARNGCLRRTRCKQRWAIQRWLCEAGSGRGVDRAARFFGRLRIRLGGRFLASCGAVRAQLARLLKFSDEPSGSFEAPSFAAR